MSFEDHPSPLVAIPVTPGTPTGLGAHRPAKRQCLSHARGAFAPPMNGTPVYSSYAIPQHCAPPSHLPLLESSKRHAISSSPCTSLTPEGAATFSPSSHSQCNPVDHKSSPDSPSKAPVKVPKKKGKMEEWERNRVDRFVAQIKSKQMFVARGDLARSLLRYVNPQRDITFYEKLVSRRRLNSELEAFLGPRIPRKRSKRNTQSRRAKEPPCAPMRVSTCPEVAQHSESDSDPTPTAHDHQSHAKLDAATGLALLMTAAEMETSKRSSSTSGNASSPANASNNSSSSRISAAARSPLQRHSTSRDTEETKTSIAPASQEREDSCSGGSHVTCESAASTTQCSSHARPVSVMATSSSKTASVPCSSTPSYPPMSSMTQSAWYSRDGNRVSVCCPFPSGPYPTFLSKQAIFQQIPPTSSQLMRSQCSTGWPVSQGSQPNGRWEGWSQSSQAMPSQWSSALFSHPPYTASSVNAVSSCTPTSQYPPQSFQSYQPYAHSPNVLSYK